MTQQNPVIGIPIPLCLQLKFRINEAAFLEMKEFDETYGPRAFRTKLIEQKLPINDKVA